MVKAWHEIPKHTRAEVRKLAKRRLRHPDPVVAAIAENLAKYYLHETRRSWVFALLALLTFPMDAAAGFLIEILPGYLSPTAGAAFIISGGIWGGLFGVAWQGRRGAKRILAAKPQQPDPAATPAAVAVDSLAPGEVDIIQR
ncbi:hypothetical protein [Frankia sp. Cr1]|uniref:hypothetical protein n=1 Tax=Frankia sp. Cr1 TaxID=3073931 RepID=UPI002AD20EC2|nr:hypothetical protein [Frankia sp. Cr1]